MNRPVERNPPAPLRCRLTCIYFGGTGHPKSCAPSTAGRRGPRRGFNASQTPDGSSLRPASREAVLPRSPVGVHRRWGFPGRRTPCACGAGRVDRAARSAQQCRRGISPDHPEVAISRRHCSADCRVTFSDSVRAGRARVVRVARSGDGLVSPCSPRAAAIRSPAVAGRCGRIPHGCCAAIRPLPARRSACRETPDDPCFAPVPLQRAHAAGPVAV